MTSFSQTFMKTHEVLGSVLFFATSAAVSITVVACVPAVVSISAIAGVPKL
jgi:hypothetical protein